jgi:SpoOM protein
VIKKVKKWLGIEGVKLEIIIPDEIQAADGFVAGLVRFQTQHSQTVTYLKLVFVEKYARGRGKEKRVDEYELGSLELHDPFEVPAGEDVDVEFTLPFNLVQSEMDELASANILLSGVVNAAKRFSGVKSEFRVEAEAKVKGTALNPFDKKSLVLK